MWVSLGMSTGVRKRNWGKAEKDKNVISFNMKETVRQRENRREVKGGGSSIHKKKRETEASFKEEES